MSAREPNARKTPGLVLTREWTATSEIRRATGWTRRHTGRVMAQLERRGLVERTMKADGSTSLWRLANRSPLR